MKFWLVYCGILFIPLKVFALNPPQPSISESDNKFNTQALFQETQPRKWRVIYTTPTLRDLREREVVLVDSGTFRLNVRNNGIIHQVELSTPVAQPINPGTARAWVHFTGTGTPTILGSYNVSSVTGADPYTINFTNAFSDTNFAVVCTAKNNGASNIWVEFNSNTTSSVQIQSVIQGAVTAAPRILCSMFGN